MPILGRPPASALVMGTTCWKVGTFCSTSTVFLQPMLGWSRMNWTSCANVPIEPAGIGDTGGSGNGGISALDVTQKTPAPGGGGRAPTNRGVAAARSFRARGGENVGIRE